MRRRRRVPNSAIVPFSASTERRSGLDAPFFHEGGVADPGHFHAAARKELALLLQFVDLCGSVGVHVSDEVPPTLET